MFNLHKAIILRGAHMSRASPCEIAASEIGNFPVVVTSDQQT